MSTLEPGRSYLVPLRTTGAGSPLFCLPGSGGDAYIFRELVTALGEGRPIYGIDLEWLVDAAQDFTIEQVATFCLDVIRKVQKQGPYFFCGYSFGGLVAYEMAKQLSDAKDSVGLVALLDTPNPASMSHLSKNDVTQFRKTYLFDRLKNYGLYLIRWDIKSFLSSGLAFATSRGGPFFMPAIKKAFRIVNRPLPTILRANDPGFLKAWKSYVPKSYSNEIVCFRAEERGPEHAFDPSMGWYACVTGGVQIHVVPGGHIDMMREPAVHVIADKLAYNWGKAQFVEGGGSCNLSS
jgi:thioesterase domain-containing protein